MVFTHLRDDDAADRAVAGPRAPPAPKRSTSLATRHPAGGEHHPGQCFAPSRRTYGGKNSPGTAAHPAQSARISAPSARRSPSGRRVGQMDISCRKTAGAVPASRPKRGVMCSWWERPHANAMCAIGRSVSSSNGHDMEPEGMVRTANLPAVLAALTGLLPDGTYLTDLSIRQLRIVGAGWSAVQRRSGVPCATGQLQHTADVRPRV
jgi:hypothetical protein